MAKVNPKSNKVSQLKISDKIAVPNQKALVTNQDSLIRRATELRRIPNERNHTSVGRWPTLVGNTLRSLRNDNYSIARNKNNSSNREAVLDSFRNTDTRLTLVYSDYSKPENPVKSSSDILWDKIVKISNF